MLLNCRSFAERLWLAVFPKRCPFCGALILPEERCCSVCAPILPYCTERPKTLQNLPVYAPFLYEGMAEQAVWRLKFQQAPSAARTLAPYLAEALPAELPFDCIIPIPMHRSKQRKRGYNQAALLAEFLGRETGLPVKPLLRKIHKTAEQHTLSARGRRSNLNGAYQLTDPEFAAGKRILLCDDVVTTGATIREAAQLLQNAGAVSVAACAVTLASRSAEQKGDRHALV